MREALTVYESKNKYIPDPDDDPFQEKLEPIFLGQCFYLLEGLAYQLDDQRSLPIITTSN